MRRRCLLTILFIVFTGRVFGLAIQLDQASDIPPQIAYANGSSPPLELTLQIVNKTLSDTEPILLWQTELHIRGISGSVGSASFTEVSLPENPLFGSSSMPITGDNLPADDMMVSDTDPSFAGVSISGHDPNRANILKVGLSFSGDAGGLFKLSASGFDESDPDHSSFWIPFSDPLPMIPFENVLSSGEIELGTIRVQHASLPGDYNGDGIVDAADYTIWRDSFGSFSYLNGNGDENGDSAGVVDKADYELWRVQFGQTAAHASSSAVVPEPTSLLLLSYCGFLLACCRCHVWQRPAPANGFVFFGR